jgi:hypothetical protein
LIFISLELVTHQSALTFDGIEAGDTASNSLLILDAKRFHLFTGNYSNAGFYHPGPVTLYVFALGEIVFHDWLGLTKSPFAGQQIALIIFLAFFICTIAYSAGLVLGAGSGLVIALVFTTTTVVFHPVFFSSAWFPHLFLYSGRHS